MVRCVGEQVQFAGRRQCFRIASGDLLTCLHETVEVEFVRVPLAVYFGHDVFVVVISEKMILFVN